MKMFEYKLTIGLFDKDTKKQEIETESAKKLITKILIDKFNITAFTLINCTGVYQMSLDGSIIYEPSIRLEISTMEAIAERDYRNIIAELKKGLNQETIMINVSVSDIDFI